MDPKQEYEMLEERLVNLIRKGTSYDEIRVIKKRMAALSASGFSVTYQPPRERIIVE